MICKTLELFLRSRRGDAAWTEIRKAAGLREPQLDPMRTYPDESIHALLLAAEDRLRLPVHALLDDVGTWICTHPPLEAVRRLIRFSGPTFVDLLWSLEELPDRARLAVPDLQLPLCRVRETALGCYDVEVEWDRAYTGAVLGGILRAMADDHGTLVYIDWAGRTEADGRIIETLEIALHDMRHAAPREFAFGVTA
jgi:hypothetical protein